MDEPIFSKHVRERLDGTFSNTGEILAHLHRVVRRKLKDIGQWNLPPRYLGFEEYQDQSWEGSAAIDDLVQEVYIVCIEKRLEKLGEHLEKRGTCEGSVRWKLGKYLTDRQEKGNPIARRVFRNVRSASESLVETEKATTSCTEKLTGKSIVLSPGSSAPDTPNDLSKFFADSLADKEFTKIVSRECPASWRTIETTVEQRFERGLSGYKITDLAKLFNEACKLPGRTSESDAGSDGDGKTIFQFLADTRTESPDTRYQTNDELDALIIALTKHAEATIPNLRIRARVIEMLQKLAELVREGEDLRQLSRRKLAETLGVSKSTLAEDFARLQSIELMQDASENETES